MSQLRTHARAMRLAATPGEKIMWLILRSPPLDAHHFRRQVVFEPHYIADFASHAAKLIIEVDGPSHELTPAADAQRTLWFTTKGFRLARYTNDSLFQDRDSVSRHITALTQ